MRLYEIEKKIKIDDDSMFEEAKEFFLSNQKFINENGGKPIFRGIKTNNNFVFSGPVENRSPLDSSDSIHEYMVELYKKNNILARRDNSIFVTNSSGFAAAYGNIYVIIPNDDYVYSYIKKSRDFFGSTAYYEIRDYLKKQKPSFDEEKLTSNICTTAIKHFRGEVCLKASSYLYINRNVFAKFRKKIQT